MSDEAALNIDSKSDFNKKIEEVIPLSCFSLILIFVVVLAEIDYESFLAKILLMAALFLSSISVIHLVENNSLFRFVSSYKSSYVLIGFFVWCLGIFASAQVDIMLNEIFGYDSEPFFYSKLVGVVFYIVGLVSPFFGGIALVSIVVALVVNFSLERFVNIKWLVVVFFIGLPWGVSAAYFSFPYQDQSEVKKLMIKVANKADFGRHSCSGIDENIKVVYLGPEKKIVLSQGSDDVLDGLKINLKRKVCE